MCSFPLARKALYVSIKLCSPILFGEWWELWNLGYSKVEVELHSCVGVNVYLLKDLMFSFFFPSSFFFKKKSNELPQTFFSTIPLKSVRFSCINYTASLINTVSQVKLFSNILFLTSDRSIKAYDTAVWPKQCESQADSLWAKNNAVPFRHFRVGMFLCFFGQWVIDFSNTCHCRVFWNLFQNYWVL